MLCVAMNRLPKRLLQPFPWGSARPDLAAGAGALCRAQILRNAAVGVWKGLGAFLVSYMPLALFFPEPHGFVKIRALPATAGRTGSHNGSVLDPH